MLSTFRETEGREGRNLPDHMGSTGTARPGAWESGRQPLPLTDCSRLMEGGVITAALREPTIQGRGVAVARWKASTGLSQIAGLTSSFLVFAPQV